MVLLLNFAADFSDFFTDRESFLAKFGTQIANIF